MSVASRTCTPYSIHYPRRCIVTKRYHGMSGLVNGVAGSRSSRVGTDINLVTNEIYSESSRVPIQTAGPSRFLQESYSKVPTPSNGFWKSWSTKE